MQIVFTSGREPGYPRNALLKTILAEHFPLKIVTDDTRKTLPRYLRLSAKLLKALPYGDYDLAFVGFLGQPLMPYVRTLTRKPIVFDAYLSVYDTLCFDRKVYKPRSIMGRLAFWLDRFACDLADYVLLDTQSHVDYFVSEFNLPKEKFSRIFIGCDENIFYPRPEIQPSSPPTILYYGSFLPLQGIDIILHAAKILEKCHMQFRLIGQGMELERVQKLAADLELSNIIFSPHLPVKKLPTEIASSTICLGGHFGAAQKAHRVIAGKTFQALAMGKPTIVGENPANHELLTHGFDAWFCKMNDPEALADAILSLLKDQELCTTLGQNAHRTFLEKASIAALAPQVLTIVNKVQKAGLH